MLARSILHVHVYHTIIYIFGC